MGLQTLRGHGPAPAGFFTCHNPKCPARRDPCSGRFTPMGWHYHPVPYTPPPWVSYRCPECGYTASLPAFGSDPFCGRCLVTGKVVTLERVPVPREVT